MDKKKNNLHGTDGKRKDTCSRSVNYMNHMAEAENHVVSAVGIRAINVVTRGRTDEAVPKAAGIVFYAVSCDRSGGDYQSPHCCCWWAIFSSMEIPHLKLSDVRLGIYHRKNVSMMPAIINTFTMVGMSLIIAVPLGLFSAIYLVEYAGRGNKLVKFIRLAAETLAGIPSIVYESFRKSDVRRISAYGYSMLAGALTLAIMVLPTILRTSEEALMSVSDSYREGSFLVWVRGV